MSTDQEGAAPALSGKITKKLSRFVQWFHRLDDRTVAWIGTIAGIVGIIVGGVTIAMDESIYGRVKETLQQVEPIAQHVDDVSKNVDQISKNVSTTNLPVWPDDINAVSELIEQLEPGDELEIDVNIGYVSFSEQQGFEKYFQALSRAAGRIGHLRGDKGQPLPAIRILVPDYATYRRALVDQFGPKGENYMRKLWDLELPKKDKGKFKTYCDKYETLIGESNLCFNFGRGGAPSVPDFLDALMFVEDDLCTTLARTRNVRVVKVYSESERPRFLWVSHRGPVMKNMVFAYPRFAGARKGYAWQTRDGRLAELFIADFNGEFNKELKKLSGSEANLCQEEVGGKIEHLYPDAVNRIKAEVARHSASR